MAASIFSDLFAQQQQQQHLLEFKAGRMFRDGETNWVRPDEAKGLVYLDKPDGLLHFYWKNRDTDTVAEDLIIFADDAEFFKVSQSSNRVYGLRFKSSGNILFFWMQHSDESKDESLSSQVNELISNPDAAEMMIEDRDMLMQMLNSSMDYGAHDEDDEDEDGEDHEMEGAEDGDEGDRLLQHIEAETRPAGSAGTDAATTTGASSSSSRQLAQLRDLLSNIQVPEDALENSAEDAVSLKDVLTPETIGPLLNDAELCAAVFPHLPEGAPHEPEEILQVVGSPQFQQSLTSLSQALNTGQLGPLVQELGLPASAGQGVREFLQAIEQQARERADTKPADTNEDRMEEDV